MDLTSIALAASLAATSGTCEWAPALQANYQGDTSQVVERFQDIPLELRRRLRQRMETHSFDEVVTIQRDVILGKQRYAKEISGIQTGGNAVCAQANRTHWKTSEQELALTYCENAYCVMVSFNGHHVGRITRLAPAANDTALAHADPENTIKQFPTAASPVTPVFAAGRILIGAKAGLSELDVGKIVAVHGAKGRRIGHTDLYILDLPGKGSETAIVALLAKNPHLKFAELDQRVAAAFVANDPYAGSAWHLNKIGANFAWDLAQGAGITIAILDSGVDGSHPDLNARMVAGWNFYDNNATTTDVFGHGTAVAGAAAATLNNGMGVSGMAGQARIMPVRISDVNGYAYWSTVAQGVSWAADQGARVANISFGGVTGSSAVQSAAQYMKNKGGLVVVAAGNNGIDEATPATATMITVSATDSNDLKTSWSSYGNFVSVAAPGLDIWTTVRGGAYQAWWGTSLASPVVAGVVGLMMSAKPDLSSSQVESLLYSSAVDLGAAGRDPYYGYGRVNAAAAVQASRAAIAPDTQAPTASISAPLNGSSVNGLVLVDVNAGDNIGVSKVELRINGATLATDTIAPFGFSWDSTKVSNGSNNLIAYAFDAAGNATASSSVSVNVSNAVPLDTIAPGIAIGSPVSGAKITGTVSVTVNANDNNGVTGITQTLFIDGVQVATTKGGTLSYNWNSRKATTGVHTIKAQAKDAAGNVSSTAIQVNR